MTHALDVITFGEAMMLLVADRTGPARWSMPKPFSSAPPVRKPMSPSAWRAWA